MSKIILTVDSACDLSAELIERYQLHTIAMHVTVGDRDCLDGVDVHADDIYTFWNETGKLPRTAAINAEEFGTFFRSLLAEDTEIVHISIGSGISASYQCACMAAEALTGVHVVDACSLSTGIGLLACVAGDRVAEGETDAARLAAHLRELAQKSSASFVIDHLDFLRAGGRCSTLAQLGAVLLNIKPSILVKNDKQGSMTVGKKYSGKIGRAALRYVQEQLAERDDIELRHAFITHSGLPEEILQQLLEAVRSYQKFENVYITRAGCTISAHCGPGTVGVLFLTK